jgi:pimeloyl-ACP methyl ester carboxylesterase
VKGRAFENPRIQLNTEMLNRARETAGRTPAGAIASPLDRLPAAALTLWSWAQSQPLLELARSAEADWSPEELVRMHQDRLRDRASLGDLPLIVLARTAGGFSDGMSIPADVLERNRRAFQADLAALSRAGRLVFAARSGHNIHVEDPDLVVRSILELVTTVRARPSSESQLRRSGS